MYGQRLLPWNLQRSLELLANSKVLPGNACMKGGMKCMRVVVFLFCFFLKSVWKENVPRMFANSGNFL